MSRQNLCPFTFLCRRCPFTFLYSLTFASQTTMLSNTQILKRISSLSSKISIVIFFKTEADIIWLWIAISKCTAVHRRLQMGFSICKPQMHYWQHGSIGVNVTSEYTIKFKTWKWQIEISKIVWMSFKYSCRVLELRKCILSRDCWWKREEKSKWQILPSVERLRAGRRQKSYQREPTLNLLLLALHWEIQSQKIIWKVIRIFINWS